MQQEQISEWTANPVTEQLKKLIASEIKDIEASCGLDAFCPFDAARTQELMANLNGSVHALSLVQDLLEGDWTYFDETEEEVDEEHFGDTSPT